MRTDNAQHEPTPDPSRQDAWSGAHGLQSDAVGRDMSRLEEQIFLECSEECRAPRASTSGASVWAMTIGVGIAFLLGVSVAALLGIGVGIVAFSLGVAIVLLANPANWVGPASWDHGLIRRRRTARNQRARTRGQNIPTRVATRRAASRARAR